MSLLSGKAKTCEGAAQWPKYCNACHCTQVLRVRMLRAVLLAWRKHAEERAKWQSASAVVRARWARRKVAACLACWADAAPALAQRRCTLSGALGRLNSRRISAAFSTWRQCATEANDERRVTFPSPQHMLVWLVLFLPRGC
jgi:hypothetical protein